jgi:uncharacterized repeat protein (TIGR01451 family)
VTVSDSAFPPNTFTQNFTIHVASGGATDLSTALFATPDPGTVEQTLTYTLSVSNVGASGAAGVSAYMTLPSSVTFLTADSSCVRSGNIVNCDLGNIANTGPASKSVQIQVRPEAGGVMLIASAEAQASLADTAPANNVAVDNTPVSGAGVREWWVIDDRDIGSGILIFNADTSVQTGTIDLGENASDLAFNPSGSRVYIAVQADDEIVVLDAVSTGSVFDLPIDDPVGVGLTPDGARVYAVSELGYVRVFNAATGAQIGADIAVGNAPQGLAITPDGKTVYVANRLSDSVSAIDVATHNVTTINLTSGDFPIEIAIAPNGKRAYVTAYGSSGVKVIDTATNTVAATITVDFGPIGIAITPDGSKAVVANFDADTVNVIDLAANTVVANPPASGSPNGVATDANGGQAWVTLYNAAGIAIVSTTTNEILTTISAGNRPLVVEYLRRKDFDQ